MIDQLNFIGNSIRINHFHNQYIAYRNIGYFAYRCT